MRVGYASPKLVDGLPSHERKQLKGRVVWASTANPYYALNGIRSGASVAAARRRLKLARPLHIGLNTWYLVPNGEATEVLKVRHGIVQEIGIAIKSLTTGRKAQLRFMTSSADTGPGRQTKRRVPHDGPRSRGRSWRDAHA